MSEWVQTQGGLITVGPITVVNQGASFGPRIATATFSRGHGRQRALYPDYLITCSADLDGRQYQDEGAVRRRAARALVAAASQAARAVIDGSVQPALGRTSAGWAECSWLIAVDVDGYARRSRAKYYFRPAGDNLELPGGTAERAAELLRAFSADLHGAIDDPANALVFGGQ